MTAPSAPVPPPPSAPPPDRQGPPLARLVVGGLLVVVGVGWLVQSTGLLDVRWQTLLSVAVLLIGATLLATARSGRGHALVPLGVVLGVLLLVVASVPAVPFGSGVGDRQYRPASVAELEPRYELGTGNLELDLRQLELPPGTTSLTAELGLGEITVRVPPDVTVDVRASAGAGELDVLGVRRDGLSPSLDHQDRGEDDAGRLVLDLSVGLGSIEVTR